MTTPRTFAVWAEITRNSSEVGTPRTVLVRCFSMFKWTCSTFFWLVQEASQFTSN